MLSRSCTLAAKDSVHVEDQADAPVAKDGATSNSGDVFKCFSEAFYDNFLLPDEIVHKQAELLALTLGNNQQAVADVVALCLHAKPLRKPDNRHQAPANKRHFIAPLNRRKHLIGGPDHFFHIEDGNDIAMPADIHNQPVDDGERKRQAQNECGSLAGHRSNIDAPTEFLYILADNIHSDASAGNIADLVGG